MTPTSLVPEQAAAGGVDFDRLVLWITEDAYARGAGGSRGAAKPRAKAPASPQARRPTAKAEGGGARSLSPQHILMIAGGVLTLALGVTLATGGRGQQIASAIGMGVDGKFGEAGFRLHAVHVQGASALATADIVRAANVHKDDPLLGMDLNALRGRVEKVGWVKEARVVRLLPDTLVISVKERRQLAVWQHGGRSVVIDDKGEVIREADPASFTGLPLVVGAGGAQHAGEILPILAQRPKLMARMEALVRVDDRRWDLAHEGRRPDPASRGGRGAGPDATGAAGPPLADSRAGLRAHRPAQSRRGGRSATRPATATRPHRRRHHDHTRRHARRGRVTRSPSPPC